MMRASFPSPIVVRDHLCLQIAQNALGNLSYSLEADPAPARVLVLSRACVSRSPDFVFHQGQSSVGRLVGRCSGTHTMTEERPNDIHRQAPEHCEEAPNVGTR